MKRLAYLHGFRSSSQSVKANQLKHAIAARGLSVEFVAPELSHDPAQAIAALRAMCAATRATDLTLVGSSLGGYYATVLTEEFGCRAVLVNPSVRPFDTLAPYLGAHTNLYTNQTFELTQAQLDALRARYPTSLQDSARYLLIATTGDEVLDWREAAHRFAGCRQVIVHGCDHGFVEFERYVDLVFDFAGVECGL